MRSFNEYVSVIKLSAQVENYLDKNNISEAEFIDNLVDKVLVELNSDEEKVTLLNYRDQLFKEAGWWDTLKQGAQAINPFSMDNYAKATNHFSNTMGQAQAVGDQQANQWQQGYDQRKNAYNPQEQPQQPQNQEGQQQGWLQRIISWLTQRFGSQNVQNSVQNTINNRLAQQANAARNPNVDRLRRHTTGARNPGPQSSTIAAKTTAPWTGHPDLSPSGS